MAITHILKAEKRELSGKKTELLREKGILPVVAYGPKQDNISLEVNSREFGKIFKDAGYTGLINLEFNNKKMPVLIRDLQYDPISNEIV